MEKIKTKIRTIFILRSIFLCQAIFKECYIECYVVTFVSVAFSEVQKVPYQGDISESDALKNKFFCAVWVVRLFNSDDYFPFKFIILLLRRRWGWTQRNNASDDVAYICVRVYIYIYMVFS